MRLGMAINCNICTRWSANKLIGNYKGTQIHKNSSKWQFEYVTYPKSSVKLFMAAEKKNNNFFFVEMN
jgi:hypothetical protein